MYVCVYVSHFFPLKWLFYAAVKRPTHASFSSTYLKRKLFTWSIGRNVRTVR